MAEEFLYQWTDNPTASGVSKCDTDVLNDCLMHLKYNNDNFLNTSQITNCLLEVPQRIKLELNDGVLTLKAGSEVIVPNGFEADGTTPKFDYVTIESDITVSGLRASTSFTMWNLDDGIIDMWTPVAVSSGTATPTPPGNEFIWYDTSNNIFKVTFDRGVTWTVVRCSLPFGVVTFDSTSITSINQVFNGFGYIGSTIWVDKGVKGLIPNGRNADGTLNNIEVVTQKVSTITFASNITVQPNTSRVLINQTGTGLFARAGSYDAENNYILGANGVDKLLGCILAENGTITQGVVDSFDFKLPFHAVDYNDKPQITGWGMPSSKYISLTLGASGSRYTAPANGWFFFLGSWSNANTYIQLQSDQKFYRVQTLSIVASGYQGLMLPITKGDSCVVSYNATPANVTFRFIYAEGEV